MVKGNDGFLNVFEDVENVIAFSVFGVTNKHVFVLVQSMIHNLADHWFTIYLDKGFRVDITH